MPFIRKGNFQKNVLHNFIVRFSVLTIADKSAFIFCKRGFFFEKMTVSQWESALRNQGQFERLFGKNTKGNFLHKNKE